MIWVGLLRYVVINSGLAERIQALEIALDDELWHQEELQKRRFPGKRSSEVRYRYLRRGNSLHQNSIDTCICVPGDSKWPFWDG